MRLALGFALLLVGCRTVAPTPPATGNPASARDEAPPPSGPSAGPPDYAALVSYLRAERRATAARACTIESGTDVALSSLVANVACQAQARESPSTTTESEDFAADLQLNDPTVVPNGSTDATVALRNVGPRTVEFFVWKGGVLNVSAHQGRASGLTGYGVMRPGSG